MWSLFQSFKNTSDNTTEYEVRFHEPNKHLSREQFTSVSQYIMDQKLPMLCKNTHEYKYLDGSTAVYDVIEKKQVSKTPSIIIKKTVIDKFHDNDFNVHLSTEEKLPTSKNTEISIVRCKNRVSFINDASRIRYDFTFVKSGPSLNTLQPSYEVEIEVIDKDICYGDFIAAIEEIRRVIYSDKNFTILIPKNWLHDNEIAPNLRDIINKYRKYVSKPETVPTRTLKPIDGYAITDKPDGQHVLLIDYLKTIYVITFPSIKIFKTKMISDKTLNFILEAEYLPKLQFFLVFDIFYLHDRDTCKLPLLERLSLIQHQVIPNLNTNWNIQLKQVFFTNQDMTKFLVDKPVDLWYKSEGFVFLPQGAVGSSKILKYKPIETVDVRVKKRSGSDVFDLYVTNDTSQEELWREKVSFDKRNDKFSWTFDNNDILELNITSKTGLFPKRIRTDKEHPNYIQVVTNIYKSLFDTPVVISQGTVQQSLVETEHNNYDLTSVSNSIFQHLQRIFYQMKIPASDQSVLITGKNIDKIQDLRNVKNINTIIVENYETFTSEKHFPCIVNLFSVTQNTILPNNRSFMKFVAGYLCNGGFIIFIDIEACEWMHLKQIYRVCRFETEVSLDKLYDNSELCITIFRRQYGNSLLEQKNMAKIQWTN